MPVFQPRTRKQILRQLVARTVARSRLTGLVKSSGVVHLLASFANEASEVYFQMARLRDVFSIDLATGSDLDKRAAEIQPGTITRRGALAATTDVHLVRSTSSGYLPIDVGTIVSARDTAGEIRFRTIAPSGIFDGSTVSPAIQVVALERGTRANVVANAITTVVTRIATVTSAYNPTAVLNGADREKDPEFRARLKAYIASLPRGTPQAIESAALALRSPTGQRVLFAKVREPNPPTGTVSLYIDDGTGNIETFSSATLTSPETVVASAAGGEEDLQLISWPVRDDGSFVLTLDAVPLVRNTDFWLNATSGSIHLAVPLTTGQVVVAAYRHYTGMIQAVQRVINGIRGLRQLPGIRAAGIRVAVLSPTRVLQSVSANATVAADFDVAAVIAAVVVAIQEYINGLDIGATVIVAEIIERAMAVPGMLDFELQSLTGSSPPRNQIILSSQIARVNASSILIT